MPAFETIPLGLACLNPGQGLGDQRQMANLLGELLLELVRGIVARALRDVAIKVCAWLDSYAHGRITKLVVGGLLGLAAFFLFPILMGLLS